MSRIGAPGPAICRAAVHEMAASLRAGKFVKQRTAACRKSAYSGHSNASGRPQYCTANARQCDPSHAFVAVAPATLVH
jgi:hypothetical protein